MRFKRRPTRRVLPVVRAERAPREKKSTLIASLLDPACYPHPVRSVRVLETHISWVLLTGKYAYKIKKPVNLGFVDFTTLDKRGRYCAAELRLNRRLAPALYLDVVEIRGDVDAPRVGGAGRLLEYAVRMQEFSQSDLASRALARNDFEAPGIDAFAALVARFHTRIPAASGRDRFGAPRTIFAAAMQNFDQMRPRSTRAQDLSALERLRAWTERQFAALRGRFAGRKRAGGVRECHGDLHLGNIAILGGSPVPFDCVEFNDELRWIDVMSEVAFIMMDLEDRARADLAWRFLNRYLEATGDYAGVGVLRFYLVYRALVRAKVHLMRAGQPGLARAENARLMRAFRGYLALARRLAAQRVPGLIVAHGLSGSGKTTSTQSLLESIGAVRIRSDVERKRLYGLAPLARTRSPAGAGIYGQAASSATYRRLGKLAGAAVRAGYPTIVDAAFLKRTEREAFRALAEGLEVPFLILDFRAPLATLRRRVTERHARGNDASEADLAVLEQQIVWREPLTPAEMAASLVVDAVRKPGAQTWKPLLRRLHAQSASSPLPRRRVDRRKHGSPSSRG